MKYMASTILCGIAMLGIYLKVEYSGWVLFVGLLGLLP